jgi:SagB-type dehydrogenase family enzyme
VVRSGRRRAGGRYRRSPALTVSWGRDGLVGLDCRTGIRVQLAPEVVALLDAVPEWITASGLAQAHPELGSVAEVRRLLEALCARRLVEREDCGEPWLWAEWTPEAAAYHFGTRGGVYPDDPTANDRRLRIKARRDPQPRPTSTRNGRRVALAPPSSMAGLSPVLLARRTWRNFGPAAVPLADLSTLLQLTWGVQKWGVVRGQGRVALKTSPSGGARHPIEAYVLAVNVEGLAPAVYHYDAARHELAAVRPGLSRDEVVRLLGKQYYFGGAGAVMVMAAVFERSMWRYPSSRVYRAIQIEAGHLGQTFCLVATELNLAPFTTIAFQDPELDAVIDVDGVHQGSVYVVGVGTRPPDFTGRPGRIQRRRHGFPGKE